MNSKAVSETMLALLLICIATMIARATPLTDSNHTISHIGDLIIDGDQTFTIENCTYIQTGNIYVKENGVLIIQNAELVMNMSKDWQYNIYIYDTGRLIVNNSNVSTSILFDINFFDRSSGDLTNSLIGGGWGRLGYVCLEIMPRSLSDISIKNCSVY